MEVLGEWHFSSVLEKRLNNFAALCASNSLDHIYVKKITRDEIKVIGMNDDMHKIDDSNPCDVLDAEVEILCEENNSYAANISALSQQLICGSSNSKLITLLQEGPLPYEELCNFSETDVGSQLQGAPDSVILHLFQTLCSGSTRDQEKFVSVLCHDLLLRKVRDLNCTFSRPLMATIQQTIEKFPMQACFELLAPLIMNPGPNSSNIEAVLTTINNNNKQVTLKSFLEGDVQLLREEQLPLLQKLVIPSLEQKVKTQLVHLISTSASTMVKSTSFGRFLVSVIKQIGPSFDELSRVLLTEVVKGHRSLQRRLVEQALLSLDLNASA